MAKRREPRVELQLPIRVFGTDINGKAFSEKIVTIDVSRRGVKLSRVQAQIKVGETIGMTHGQTKGRFVVRWVGAIGTPRAGQIGIEYTSPEKPFWSVPLPEPTTDDFGRQTGTKTAVAIFESSRSIQSNFILRARPRAFGAKQPISAWVDALSRCRFR